MCPPDLKTAFGQWSANMSLNLDSVERWAWLDLLDSGHGVHPEQWGDTVPFNEFPRRFGSVDQAEKTSRSLQHIH
jgi:hypothetical protein